MSFKDLKQSALFQEICIFKEVHATPMRQFNDLIE